MEREYKQFLCATRDAYHTTLLQRYMESEEYATRRARAIQDKREEVRFVLSEELREDVYRTLSERVASNVRENNQALLDLRAQRAREK